MFVQVIAPHSAQHMIFVPKSISKHQESILHLLDMHCGEATGVITANKGQLRVKNDHKTILCRVSCIGGAFSVPGAHDRLAR